jgi:hypothetical protein
MVDAVCNAVNRARIIREILPSHRARYSKTSQECRKAGLPPMKEGRKRNAGPGFGVCARNASFSSRPGLDKLRKKIALAGSELSFRQKARAITSDSAPGERSWHFFSQPVQPCRNGRRINKVLAGEGLALSSHADALARLAVRNQQGVSGGEAYRCVDFRATSSGTMRIFSGRTALSEPICSSSNSAARAPISRVF